MLLSLTNYAIPPDNPYIGSTNFNGTAVNPANVRTELWAVGVRNPWRFCFDPAVGSLYLGHVGQNSNEWVNIVTNKANCGWNFYQGDLKWSNSLPSGFVLNPPITEYGHTTAATCFIGGIVYRGAYVPQLYGAYLYADYSSGESWALRCSGGTLTQNSVILTNSSGKFSASGLQEITEKKARETPLLSPVKWEVVKSLSFFTIVSSPHPSSRRAAPSSPPSHRPC